MHRLKKRQSREVAGLIEIQVGRALEVLCLCLLGRGSRLVVLWNCCVVVACDAIAVWRLVGFGGLGGREVCMAGRRFERAFSCRFVYAMSLMYMYFYIVLKSKVIDEEG